MPSARQPATALADRAERHVFERLGDLPAVQRRALALVDLAGAERAAAARDLGLGEDELGRELAAARKALRRTLAPLAGGGRCERAELLVSERLDAPLDRVGRKWLEIHLARCPRCIEHVELLEAARAELREAFIAAPLALPAALPPAVEPPSLERGSEAKAQLRVVPVPAEPEPPAAEPASEAIVGGKTGNSDGFGSPRQENADTTAAAPSLPLAQPARAAKPARRPSPTAKRAAKVLAIILAVAALLAGLGLGIDALSGNGKPQTAPWSQPGAPDIKPAPLSGQ